MHSEEPHSAEPAEPALWTPGQLRQAWALHVFTTLGIVVAMLALRDVLEGHADRAILWLLATQVIDGVDGPIARAWEVQKRVPKLDGHTLDLIIDFVACVIVPIAFMYEFDLVPVGFVGAVLLGLAVFTSAIWFSRTDMMTDDNWFRGFPAAWNLVAPVLYLLHAREWIGGVITLVLSLASLTNLLVPHIMRAKYLRPVTVVVSVAWLGAMALGAILLPTHQPRVIRWILIWGSAYYIALAAWQAVRTHRAESGAID